MPKRFAVIGNPIAHSLSPTIHQCFAQQTKIVLTYEKIKGDDTLFESQVLDFFKQGGTGLNVTAPYKQRAFALAEQHSTRCTIAGAANTLWMNEGKLHADNTDGIGLIRDLTHYINLANKNILILGAGGAVRGILHPLLAAKIATLTIANRTLATAQDLQKEFPQICCTSLAALDGHYDLIINATSTGLSGNTLTLPTAIMSSQPLCYDLAYQQKSETPFVHYAKSQGCIAKDGLGMLIEQAAEAFFIWNGVMPETSEVFIVLVK